MYSALILVYVPAAVLAILLAVVRQCVAVVCSLNAFSLLQPFVMAVKGIKRFNRDYWKEAQAGRRPPGKYTIGRRRLGPPPGRADKDGKVRCHLF